MATIRHATEADLPAMVEMGRALHDESPRYQHMSFNPDKLRRLFHSLQGTLLSKPGCVLVAEHEGHIVGMTVGIIAERWFSDDLYLSELTMYVRPEHRSGATFLRLVRSLERWAAGEGVADLALGVSTEIHADATVRAYQALGYQLAGYSMVKRNGN